jgi:hypothetical protein
LEGETLAENHDIDMSPRPGEGKYLAQSVAKLEGRLGLPDKPFVVWAVGSSFTNGLGDGSDLRRLLYERFPNAPEIVYKKQCGSGTQYHHIRGWVNTVVVSEQPDLVLCYANGDPKDLAAMLKDIRKQLTADVIIPSLHFVAPELDDYGIKSVDDLDKLDTIVDNCRTDGNLVGFWSKVRSFCEELEVEFVDSRRELMKWCQANRVMPTDLLIDICHQTTQGALLVNKCIARHFVPGSRADAGSVSREWRVSLAEALAGTEQRIEFMGDWEVRDGSRVTSQTKGACIRATFEGNRVDLIGYKVQDGGRMRVTVDGVAADGFPVYMVSYVQPDPSNTAPSRIAGSYVNHGPHGVSLGSNIVPQSWVIQMVDDCGNYEVVGSVTGHDGVGNNQSMFTSNSGQIIIDPALWRHAIEEGEIQDKKGNRWTFEVWRCANGAVDFALDQRTECIEATDDCDREAAAQDSDASSRCFSTPLVQNMVNGLHTIELVVEHGPVEVDSLYFFRPIA